MPNFKDAVKVNGTTIIDACGNVSSGGVATVTTTGTQTLTNKTMTAPKIASGGYIADANGNELVKFTTTSSAVNEITYANAATGGNPTITATGGDTNIGITVSQF